MSDSDSGRVSASVRVKREHSRRLATQALYKHHFDPLSAEAVIREFRSALGYGECDKLYFMQLVRGAIREAANLDAHIKPLIDRALESLDPIEHALLRMGTFELLFLPGVPARVVIDQGIRLAKQFGATGSHTYVNAVLDQIARQVRREEFKEASEACHTSSN